MLVFVANEEGDSLFTVAKLNCLRAAVRNLEKLPEVKRVVALTELVDVPDDPASPIEEALRNALRLQILNGQTPQLGQAISLKPWWPETRTEQEKIDLDQARNSMTHDPLLADKFVSSDGQAHCMILQLHPEQMGLRARWAIRSKIIDIMHKNGLGQQPIHHGENPSSRSDEASRTRAATDDRSIHVAGLAVSEGWILVELVSSLKVQLPLGALAIALIVYGMYRSLAIAGLTLLVGAIASVWAIAVTGLIFGKITILVAAVPLLIVVISTSNTVHIVSAFGRELTKGESHEAALERVIRDLGGACVLTSLTTLVGFLSLLTIPVTAIRHLAVVAGFGVGLALILAIAIVPIGIALLKFTPQERASRSNALINWLTAWLVQFSRWASTKYPRTIIAFHLILVLIAAFYAVRIKFDPNLTQRFHASHPMPIDVDYFNQRFYGTNVIEIFVKANADQLISPPNLRHFAAFCQHLKQLPGIESVTSLNDLFDIVDRTIDYQSQDGLPPSRNAANASLALLSQFQPEAVQGLVTPERNMIRISAFTSLGSFFDVLELSREIDKLAEKELPGDLSASISGIMPTIASSVDRIVDSQFMSMIFCYAVVMLMIVVALRSLRLGIIGLPSNVVPMVLLAGCLGFQSEFIDSDYIIIFTIAFGIAVDDTIHFLHRYDIESAQVKDRRQAIDLTFGYTGRAIVQTTTVLCLGLLPLALSNYLTIWMLGTYLVLTLFVALLADLFLLPALVLLWGE